MIETKLNITKPYWVIVYMADPNGYHTGTKSSEIVLIESDDILELDDFIADKSVEAGESMGDYVFKVLSISPSWEIFHQVVKDARNEKEVEEYENRKE